MNTGKIAWILLVMTAAAFSLAITAAASESYEQKQDIVSIDLDKFSGYEDRAVESCFKSSFHDAAQNEESYNNAWLTRQIEVCLEENSGKFEEQEARTIKAREEERESKKKDVLDQVADNSNQLEQRIEKLKIAQKQKSDRAREELEQEINKSEKQLDLLIENERKKFEMEKEKLLNEAGYANEEVSAGNIEEDKIAASSDSYPADASIDTDANTDNISLSEASEKETEDAAGYQDNTSIGNGSGEESPDMTIEEDNKLAEDIAASGEEEKIIGEENKDADANTEAIQDNSPAGEGGDKIGNDTGKSDDHLDLQSEEVVGEEVVVYAKNSGGAQEFLRKLEKVFSEAIYRKGAEPRLSDTSDEHAEDDYG